MPSRNWCIFLTVVGTISYMYYDDRRQCKQIRQEYIDKVEYLSKQQMSSSLDIPRKVTVYGARWPEDDESDRALRHFRKYVKVSWIYTMRRRRRRSSADASRDHHMSFFRLF